MTNFTLTAQTVGGDPFQSGGNINIVNNSFSDLTFIEVDNRLGIAQTGEFVSFDGGVTLLSYEFLGYGDVRGDPNQFAGFIRVDMGDGTYQTFAIDMDADGDGIPNLDNGNTKLTVAGLDTTVFEKWPVCFAAGTRVATPQGPRPVESLSPGDMVLTRDHGAQPVRWIGHKRFRAQGICAPVRFETGAIGNTEPLLVSQQHRMLMSDWRTQLLMGEDEVLVAAKHLVNDDTIRICTGGTVEYFHLLFDRHEILEAAGVPSESYFPGHAADSAEAAVEAELAMLFEELSIEPADLTRAARPVMRRFETSLLVA